jgi:hypothetical protein
MVSPSVDGVQICQERLTFQRLADRLGGESSAFPVARCPGGQPVAAAIGKAPTAMGA